ncbi:hypothetical protein [Thiolapillus sp.]|uniref:hypothetical protein n=1 Tax=Thiolapillus sp. TaxID=2017437 RepID=UPI003AF8E3A4
MGHHTHKVRHSHKQDTHTLDNRRSTKVADSHTSRRHRTSSMAPIHQTRIGRASHERTTSKNCSQ